MHKLTQRQQLILKHIVEDYIKTSEPISSKIIYETYFSHLSSQTIRAEMGVLEKYGFIEKRHTSSGRVPTIQGYDYYNDNMLIPIVDQEVIDKLEKVFQKRYNDVDEVIYSSLNIINEVTGLISLSTAKAIQTETVKNINLVPIDDNKAVVIIVTNLGNTPKAIISFNNADQNEDIQTCIKIFNKYLIDVSFNEIETRLKELEPIIKKEVMEYEYVLKELISKMLGVTNKNMKSSNNHIVGLRTIFDNPEFNDYKKIKQLVDIIEEGSIWEMIKFDMDNENENNNKYQIKTTHYEELPISITSTTLEIDKQKFAISVLGPNRVDTKKIFGILEYIKDKLNAKFSK